VNSVAPQSPNGIYATSPTRIQLVFTWQQRQYLH